MTHIHSIERCSSAEDLRGRHTCSIDEAANLLGIGRSTAYAAARDGSLPVLRISGRLLVPTAKLLVLLGYEDSDRHPE
jgi:excisionase family DNA binding protein